MAVSLRECGLAIITSFLYIWASVGLCNGCGIATHTEIGYRAMSFLSHTSSEIDYKQLLLENQDALEAGNPYPDSFYDNICYGGTYYEVSEDTHWAEFLNATINYIRVTYPMPWDNDTRKLVAFVFGFVSHQVADVLWHSLGIDQGFLSAMGFVDYHGSFDDAHAVGDLGGDVVNVFREDLSYSDPIGDWYVPTSDLLNIYQQFYQKQVVTEELLTDCVTLLFLGRLGERIALAKAYPKFAAESPFLVDNLDTYFLGGQYDMAVWTNRIWNETIYMLEHGSGDCEIPHNPLFIRCPNINPSGMYSEYSNRMKGLHNGYFLRSKYYGFRDDGTNIFGLSKNDVVIERTARGMTIGPTLALRDRAKKVKDATTRGSGAAVAQEFLEKVHQQSDAAANSAFPNVTISSTTSYARLGESLLAHDLNGDGNDDLVLAAPGYGQPGNPEQGAVYIIYDVARGIADPASDRPVESMADVTLLGIPYQAARFGSALAVIDLNADGVPDLAVSSPSMGSSNLSYTGMVSVFFGHPNLPLLSKPDITINCKLEHCNFGSTLAGSDVDGDGYADLVVGAPHAPGPAGVQSGLVAVFFSSPSWHSGAVADEDNADWIGYGNQAYEWYGGSIHASQLPMLGTYLLVGAPNHRLCAESDCSFSPNDVQSVGSVYLYSPTASFKLIHQFVGIAAHSHLGSSLAVGRPMGTDHVLALASPAQDITGAIGRVTAALRQAGGVDLYNLTALVLDNAISQIASFYGDRFFSRFGHRVQFADTNGDQIDELYVSAPLHTEDYTEEFHPGEQGVVVVYAGTSSRAFPLGNATMDGCGSTAPLIVPCPETIAEASFRYAVNEGHLGFSLSAGHTKAAGFLAVGAPHSPAGGSRLGGSVAIYFDFL